MDDALLAYNPDKPVSLPGRKCAYCGTALKRRSTTKDHVVGRNFVPEGTLATGFFLQVKSCRPCNDRKAALEDDISLITMLPDTSGKYVSDDDRLRRTVARKSRGAVSPATRRLAAQSYVKINARMPVQHGLSLTYDGIAMPMIDEQRVARLAFFHLQGFCQFRSFDPQRGHGAWLKPNRCLVLGHVTKEDWGNPRLLHFVTATRAWESVCLVALADGYFRHEMRKKPGADLWSWALEWNKRYRIFGLYGGAVDREAFVATLPQLPLAFRYGDTTNGFAMRYETSLHEDADQLFGLPENFAERPFASPHWR